MNLHFHKKIRRFIECSISLKSIFNHDMKSATVWIPLMFINRINSGNIHEASL